MPVVSGRDLNFILRLYFASFASFVVTPFIDSLFYPWDCLAIRGSLLWSVS